MSILDKVKNAVEMPENKPTDINRVNEQYFEKIKYQHLAEEFKKLGVPKAFKIGTKREKLIKEALVQLTILKRLKEEGVDEENIQERILLERGELQNKEDENFVAEVKRKVDVSRTLEDEIRSKNYELPTLYKALENININLAGNVETDKLLLVKKKKALLNIISEKEALKDNS